MNRQSDLKKKEEIIILETPSYNQKKKEFNNDNHISNRFHVKNTWYFTPLNAIIF